jgi:GNAT superfamily N-acetyltransferase
VRRDAAAPAYEFDDERDRIDLDAVWAFMSDQAYWGRWRSREVIETQVRNSWRLVGVYHRPTGDMIGFGRAVGDGASLAYLADVYVLPEHRGHGLGVELLQFMIEEGPGVHFRWMLHTKDAHGLYAKAGFQAPDVTFLERPGRAAPSA